MREIIKITLGGLITLVLSWFISFIVWAVICDALILTIDTIMPTLVSMLSLCAYLFVLEFKRIV